MRSTHVEAFVPNASATIDVNPRYPRWNARRSSATCGYFAASASTSPISTSTFSTPGHSVLAPRNQRRCPMTRAVWNVLPGIKSCTHWTGAQIWTDYNALACSIFMQHENFNGITQVTVIKLIIADAVKSHRRIRRDHEIKCGARWPAIKKWCWEPAGRNSLVADKRDAHETARGVRLQLQERRESRLRHSDHSSFFTHEHRTPNFSERRNGFEGADLSDSARTVNLKVAASQTAIWRQCPVPQAAIRRRYQPASNCRSSIREKKPLIGNHREAQTGCDC